VYRVLALNCLVSAYMMSSLYLQGLKQGDTQMTALGLLSAALFYFVSTAQPLARLSEHRPPHSVFAPSVILSIFGQFLIHLSCLFVVLALCRANEPVESDSFEKRFVPDSVFRPNLVNSSIYLLSATIQINNFVINYRGYPFTQDIWENIPLYRSLQVAYCVIATLVSGVLTPLNDFLQIVEMPNIEFRYALAGILVFNGVAGYGIEKVCQRLERKN
jgi:manganese-transporting P-type ATPase